MGHTKKVGLVVRPPCLDGKNYAFLKAGMTAYLKSIDSKTLKAFVYGWSPPRGKDHFEGREGLDGAEDEASLENSRAFVDFQV